MKENKEIHVLYIITKLELGGAQKVCLTLFNGIQNSGYPTHLVSGSQGELAPTVINSQTHATKPDAVFFLDSLKREIGIKIIFSEIKAFFSLIKIIRSLKNKYPQLIIHTHSTKAGIFGRWAAFFAGAKKRIHTVHGYGFHEHQPKHQWAIVYFLEYITSLITTKFICVSKKDQLEGIRLFPKFEQKSVLIRAAVNWDDFYMPARTSNISKTHDSHTQKQNYTQNITHDFTIGSIACFKPQKNCLDLLKAFKLLVQNTQQRPLNQTTCIGFGCGLKLEIIGDGEQRPMLENWISKNNMSSYITLLGWQHDVSKYVKKWDLFALSSLWEGLPCAIIEARLSKLPIVAYNVGGISEVIYDGKNGFLIKPGDWQDLSKKLETLVMDKKLYTDLSNFPDTILDFKNENMIKYHVNLYTKLFQKITS
ncbi:MAG: glycosyltransferase [bacterium]